MSVVASGPQGIEVDNPVIDAAQALFIFASFEVGEGKVGDTVGEDIGQEWGIAGGAEAFSIGSEAMADAGEVMFFLGKADEAFVIGDTGEQVDADHGVVSSSSWAVGLLLVRPVCFSNQLRTARAASPKGEL